MSNFDPTTSDLANIPVPTLQQWLVEAMTALHQVSIGQNAQTLSYAQADGSRSVTYNAANIGDLKAWIAKLNAQLGVPGGRRRPMRVIF